MKFVARNMVIAATALCLVSCGGGGGGADGGGGSGVSAIPSTGSGASCSNSSQLSFVRNHIDQDYLFYKGAPSLSPASYGGTPENYFYDLTTRGQPSKDRFSFVITQAQAQAIFQDGAGTGIGVDTRRDSQGRLRIALVQPGSPAAASGLQRGDWITRINGAPVGASMTDAQINALYYSTPGTQLSLGYQRLPSTSEIITNLTATTYSVDPVPIATTLSSNGAKIGYIAFHEHTAPSETKLADAFKKISQAGATDLVLDLRYNGGGYLLIASQVAYMIAGANTKSSDVSKVFDRLQYNDKRTAENYSFEFVDYLYLDSTRRYETLPSLNLNRVYVLTTGSSCSASEAIINGLRGIDVDVITIGNTTCGKPYGFEQKDNCSNSYFAISFQGFNAKGFGEYANGMTPTCSVQDDLDHDFADTSEAMLSAALSHRNTGVCPATFSSVQASTASSTTLVVQDHAKRASWGTAILNPR